MSHDSLEHQRHSLAHLLAAAVLEIYPDALPTLGPAIDNGFYYDFEFKEPISDDDLKAIEKIMRKRIGSWKSFEGKKVSAAEARKVYEGNPYKLELIDEIEKKGEEITLYTSGKFTDLCRGGHTDDLSKIDPKSFKLDKTAGAYWRGDENNKMLTRIYGLAFESKEDVIDFIKQREEAKERDHRKIGKEQNLFTFSEFVGPGLPLFTPKGTAMRNAIIKKINELQSKYDYKEVWIPHITKPELYKKSGHWEKFGDELFRVKGKESEFVIKPMNCPHHTQIFDSEARSYKDLPLRFTETTTVYRDEQSGELLGLGRVRSITQDDGHVFCTEDQIEEEIEIIVDVIKDFYTLLGLFREGNYSVSLSTRDPKNPDKYLGDKEVWKKAEDSLEDIAKKNKLPYEKVEGEAAFYGPKLDFMFKDAIGRLRQLSTIQLDFNMPKRFDLTYTDSDGKKKTPVMIHRAIAGSLERFLSIIIEHFNGSYPFWMSPVQVNVLPIAQLHNDFAQKVTQSLKDAGIRVELNNSNDGLGKKVSKSKKDKLPYFIIIGDKDIKDNKVTLESRDDGNLGQFTIEELIDKFKEEN